MNKDYKVDIKVKNNLLYQAMVEEGFDTAASLARAVKLCPSNIGACLNLKLSLYNAYGEMRPVYEKISKVLRRLPEDLVPRQHHHEGLKKNTSSVCMDLNDVQYLLPEKGPDKLLVESLSRDKVGEALDSLTGKESSVIKCLFGLDGIEKTTQAECGELLGISPARVHQYAQRGLRKLRHPSRKLEGVMRDIAEA